MLLLLLLLWLLLHAIAFAISELKLQTFARKIVSDYER